MTDVDAIIRLAPLPLLQRRLALWLMVMARYALQRRPASGLAPVLEDVIAAPGAVARKLDRKIEFNDALSMLEWATFKFRTTKNLIVDSRRSTILNEPALARAAAEQRPVIFAPLHMGAYVLAIANLVNRHFKGRRILIIRNHAENESDEFVLRRLGELGCEVRFMNIKEKATFIDALRFARGNAVIVCFVDLPASYGSPETVELFRRPAQLAMGIELLARAIGGIVIPMSVQSDIANDQISIGQPFEVGPASQNERARITSLVRDHVESTILAYPEHWHMWGRVQEYFMADQTDVELTPLREDAHAAA